MLGDAIFHLVFSFEPMHSGYGTKIEDSATENKNKNVNLSELGILD